MAVTAASVTGRQPHARCTPHAPRSRLGARMRGPAGPAGHARRTREEDGMTSGEHRAAAPTRRDRGAGAYAGSVPASGTSRRAIVPLLLSLAGLVPYGLTSSVGIVLGPRARGQITRTGEQG